jgi:hypothetical protein
MENGEFGGTRDLIIDEKNIETTPMMNPFAGAPAKGKSKKKSGNKNQSSKKKTSNISNPQVGYIDGLRANEEDNDQSDNDRGLDQTFDRRNGTHIKIEVLEKSPNPLAFSEKHKPIK